MSHDQPESPQPVVKIDDITVFPLPPLEPIKTAISPFFSNPLIQPIVDETGEVIGDRYVERRRDLSTWLGDDASGA